MHVCIEKIVTFGDVLEIEIMTSTEKVTKAKQEITTFLTSIGINQSQILQNTVTSMIMQKQAVFDNSIDISFLYDKKAS